MKSSYDLTLAAMQASISRVLNAEAGVGWSYHLSAPTNIAHWMGDTVGEITATFSQRRTVVTTPRRVTDFFPWAPSKRKCCERT